MNAAARGPALTWFGLHIEPAPAQGAALEWAWLRQFRYALLDGQRAEDLPEAFPVLEVCPPAFAASAHLMPRLVDLHALKESQLTWLIETLDRCVGQRESPPFTALLSSEAEPEQLAKQLASAQLLRHAGEQAWLRVHDPLVFLQLARVMDQPRLRALFGAVQRWSLCVAGEWFDAQLAPAEAGHPIPATALWQGLLRIGAVNRCLLQRDWLSLPAVLRHSEHLDRLVQRAAERHGLERPAEQAAFADLGAELLLDFDEHPSIDAAVQAWKGRVPVDGDAGLIDELEQLPAATWERVRHDCALDATKDPMTDKTKVCDYCDKRGVPILPLRYAVAPAGAGLPAASGPEIALDAQAAHYTRRLLRSGYLYVFDEARKRWDDYFVTADGYFFRLHSSPGVPPVLPQKPFNCPDLGHAAVASFITIPDAKRATKVWLGFSDVQWTAAVRQLHQSSAYRARHMRCVDVKAYANSVDKAHCLPIAGVADGVTEYKFAKAELAKRLSSSPFAPVSRLGTAPQLVKEAERLAPKKGFAVVLSDPAGIAQELALLMKRNHDLFVEQPALKYGVAIDGVLTQMELAIKQQGERDRLMQAQRDAVNATNPGYMGYGDGGSAAAGGMALARLLNPKLDKDLEAIEEGIRNVPGTELDAAADKAWAKYAKKLKAGERTQWRQAFETQARNYDAKFIAPLAKAHAQWMQHASMHAHFDCNFDSHDLRSGAVYTALLAHCISATADKKACFDLYTQWLDGDATDTKNLLLRGLVYDHTPMAEEIQKSIDGSTDWAGLPWDKVIESFDKASAKLIEGQADALGRLVGNLTGPIAGWLRRAVERPGVVNGLVLLAAAARQPIVEVQIDGGRKAFRALLIRQLFRLSGQQVAAGQMQRAVAEELRRLRMHGVPLEGTEKKRWLLMIDPKEVRDMPQGLSPKARAQWLASKLRTPEQVEQVRLDRFMTKFNAAVGGHAGLVFAMLGVLANWVALDSVREGERKALAHAKGEGLARVCAQGAQLIGAVAATLETGLAKLPVFASSVGRGIQVVGGRLLGILGKTLGVGGSLVMAGIDFWRAGKELQQENYAGAAAFAVSGILGAAATLLLLFGATGVGLVVVGLMILWAFVMTTIVDNSVQDWMERCKWGVLVKERYNNFDAEIQELKSATQG